MAAKTEFFEIVDENDQVIGLAPRAECHGNPCLVHRVAHVLVFDRKGNVLLQKRSAEKDIQPGKWDTSVGGHLDPGEDYLEAALREMAEELGVRDVPVTFLYKSRIRNEIESENVSTYMTVYEGPVQIAVREIDEVRFWSPSEIEASLGTGRFTPNFEEEWVMFGQCNRRYPSAQGEGLAFCAGDSLANLSSELKGE